jgi:O-antigen ligase
MHPTNNQNRFLRAASILTMLYLCVVFLGVPLIFSNLYFNITETKQTLFLVASGVYLILLLFARIAFPPDYGVKSPRAPLHPATISLLAFFLVSLVGALLSKYPDDIFWGQNNRYQGLLTILTYALVVLALSRREIDLRWPLSAFLLAASLASVLGLVNHFGVDLFGFYQNLRKEDLGRFLSTLGNADFYGSYLVLAFPVALNTFLHAKGRRSFILSAAAMVCVFFGVLVAGSDSAALGLLATAVVFPLLLFNDASAMRRLMLGWGVFFLAAFVFGLFSGALPSKTYLSFFTVTLSRAVVSLPLAMAAFALWFLLRRARQERLLRLRRPYWVVLVSAVGIGVLALVLLNTAFVHVPLGSLSRYLRFNASWGTDRGQIWAFVLRFFGSQPPLQQLLGGGSGVLFHADAIKPLFSDAALDTAHNEYLQYLVTNGILGLMSYLAALVFALRTGILRGVRQPAFLGLSVAVIAYAVQATVNIAQPASTPLLFVLLGVLICRDTALPQSR